MALNMLEESHSTTSLATTRHVADGDITILVHGHPFVLHKFPLVSRSGKIRKMVEDAKDPYLTTLDLKNSPGGPQTFELAAKFCYGINFQITTSNVAHLHCLAQFLEMTHHYSQENLLTRTETYLKQIVDPSFEKSLQVLSSCQTLLPLAQELGIPERCIDAIARGACKEQLVTSLSRLDCGSGSLELEDRCAEWWIEDLSLLSIDFYKRIVIAMGGVGVRTNSIVASIMHYAQVSLKGIGKSQIWNPLVLENGQREITETLITLLPEEKSSSVPLNFLFGMLRIAILVEASIACRVELERRIAFRLEMVSLDDLLIPSVQTGDSLFDVETIQRILTRFLQRIEEEDEEDSGYESEGIASSNHDCLLKVGRLIDAYLAEISPDPYLSLPKFIAMIQVLPDYARAIDDGLYRAIDIYLKAHPMLSEHECKKLCKLIECQKLSQEACNHAAQNERLPVQMIVRVLYYEQLSLKIAMSGSFADGGSYSQKFSSGVQSAAMSPRDTYASLRRENRELKLEVSRMRVRLSEVEKEQLMMKQRMMGNKSGHGKTLLTSISKGIGRIAIFGQHKKPGSTRKSHRKTGRSRMYSHPLSY